MSSQMQTKDTNTNSNLTPEQAFNIIDIVCSRTVFTLTPPDFFQFAEAMKVIKTFLNSYAQQESNSKN